MVGFGIVTRIVFWCSVALCTVWYFAQDITSKPIATLTLGEVGSAGFALFVAYFLINWAFAEAGESAARRWGYAGTAIITLLFLFLITLPSHR